MGDSDDSLTLFRYTGFETVTGETALLAANLPVVRVPALAMTGVVDPTETVGYDPNPGFVVNSGQTLGAQTLAADQIGTIEGTAASASDGIRVTATADNVTINLYGGTITTSGTGANGLSVRHTGTGVYSVDVTGSSSVTSGTGTAAAALRPPECAPPARRLMRAQATTPCAAITTATPSRVAAHRTASLMPAVFVTANGWVGIEHLVGGDDADIFTLMSGSSLSATSAAAMAMMNLTSWAAQSPALSRTGTVTTPSTSTLT